MLVKAITYKIGKSRMRFNHNHRSVVCYFADGKLEDFSSSINFGYLVTIGLFDHSRQKSSMHYSEKKMSVPSCPQGQENPFATSFQRCCFLGLPLLSLRLFL